MNITLNIPKSNISITIEGTQPEMHSIINMLLQISKPLNAPAIRFSPKTAVTSKKASVTTVPSAIDYEVHNGRAFIASLYVYKSSVHSPHGQPRYAAEMLLDGKPHSISEITKVSNASYHSVINMIKLLRSAGATILVDTRSKNEWEYTYTLVSVPNKKYRVRKRSNTGKPRKNIVKTSADFNASSILSGKKA